MAKRMAGGITILLAGCWFVVLPLADAQQIGFRDLTEGWRPPSEHVPSPDAQNCPQVKSSISGGKAADTSNTSSQAGQTLELTILAIVPPKLEIGKEFTATVRLKNTGAQAVLVPSVADGEQLVHPSAEKSEEKYEAGDVSFRLTTGKAHRVPIFLDSTGALFADPDDPSSYLSLAPGNWLDIKLKATVECGLENCLGQIHPDNHASLTAWWYQRVLTHRVNGCDEDHGSLKVRELDSAPMQVVVRTTPTTARSGPHN